MQVRIVRLEPMHVACIKALGATPEADAWTALLTWARGKGLLDGVKPYRLFGYDDPSGGKNGLHGYDTWITVSPDIRCRPEERVQIQEFAGGLYAVTRCRLPDIVDTWARLREWVTNSPYPLGNHQWLEEYLTLPADLAHPHASWQDTLLDLYHPVA